MATINKNLSEYDKNAIPSAKDFRFGIVVSEWNDTITEGLFNGAISGLIENEVPADHIIRWNVPGSFELVYGAQRMIVTQEVDVVDSSAYLREVVDFGPAKNSITGLLSIKANQ